MKTIIDYLDDLKEKNGSDYKTAKLLKTSTGAISTLRERKKCGDETAIKIADLLGIDQGEVLIAAAIARSEGAVKNAWERTSKRMGIAASIALGTALTLANSSAGSFLLDSIQLPNNHRIYFKNHSKKQIKKGNMAVLCKENTYST